MRDILQEIVENKKVEVEHAKSLLPPAELYRRVEALLDFSIVSMKEALSLSSTGIIAEFKRKSTTKD